MKIASFLLHKKGRAKFWAFTIIAFAISFAATINTIDDDALLTSKKYYSVHFWIAKSLSWSPQLLILLNIVMMIYILRRICIKSDNWAILFLLVNPFMVFNTLDAFNKFATISFLSLLLGDYVHKKNGKFTAVLILGLMTSIHPLSILSASLMMPLACYPFIALLYWLFGNAIPDSVYTLILGDKADLLATYGTSLAASSGGNYKLIESSSMTDIGGLTLDPYAPFRVLWFPAFMESSPSLKDILLATYMLTGFLGLFVTAISRRHAQAVIALLIMLFLIPTFIGNIAVIFRHILPLLPAIIIVILQKPVLKQVLHSPRERS